MNQPNMLGYIRDQGRALKHTLEIRDIFCDPVSKLFKKRDIRKVYILGSGTSYNAALAIRQYLEQYMPVDAEAVVPTVFTNYARINNNCIYQKGQILVIGISQSGTSISTIEAMKRAGREGYCTVAVTEAMDSPITKEVDLTVKLTCGKELIPVETRGYTVTLLEGYLTVIKTACIMGRVSGEECQKAVKSTGGFLEQFDQILARTEVWYDRNKEELLAMRTGVIAAYGLNCCTAAEGELKINETFKIPMKAYEMEEMLHGPQMAFDQDTYVFLVASDEAEFERAAMFYQFFEENHVTDHVFIITNRQMKLREKDLLLDFDIPVELSPLAFVLPFQVIAAKNCIECGIDTSHRPPGRKSFAHMDKEGA